MAGFHLRPAQPDDAPALISLMHRSREAVMPGFPRLHSAEADQAFFAHMIQSQDVTVGLSEDSHLAGFMALEPGWINQLYLHPDFFRQGLGSRLMAKAKAAQEQLELWAFQHNAPARRFYQNQGFRLAELTDGAGNEEGLPDLRLIWQRTT